MMKILMTLSTVLLSLMILMSAPSYAQDYMKEGDFTAGSDIELETRDEVDELIIKKLKEDEAKSSEKKTEKNQGNDDEKLDATIIVDVHKDVYFFPTLTNISRLYWKKNALELDNKVAVDNYMLINECDIYQKFHHDDFEWIRVRDAARKMLEDGKEAFPDKFKMIVPIDLGRYDLKQKGFPLINKTAFRDLRRVEIGGNSNQEPVCGNYSKIDKYPRNFIMILNKPFNFDFIEMDEHVAQAYIVRQKYQRTLIPLELKNKGFERLAYARMRFSLSEYQGETIGKDSYPLAIFFGKINGIDIFEDPYEKRLLATFDIR